MLTIDIIRSVKPERIEKGASLLSLPDEYVCIDLETTGLDPQCDDIIEVCASRVAGGIIKQTYSTLVRPPFEISEYISELTGITNEMLRDQPTINTVLPELLDFVGRSVIVGHNVNFDINFLYDECIRQGREAFSNDFVDTMRISRRLFPDFENHKLKTLVEKFECSLCNTHRAQEDVAVTVQCYEYMKNYTINNNIQINQCRKSKNHSTLRAKDITPNAEKIEPSNPFFNKTVVFTGVLERMTRKAAMQYISDIGGFNGDGVTQKTHFLVLGNNDYCASIKDGKSTKQKKAEKLKLSGYDIEIISERVFYDMIESEA